MRIELTIVAALGLISAPAPAQEEAAPAAAPAAAASEADVAGPGIVVPNGSPLRLAAVTRAPELNATFNGSVEISGTYEVQLYGESVFASLWPDEKSRKLLPNWDGWGEVDEIYIANSEEFAAAVISKEELAKLKAGRLPLIRGQATIVADQYETGIECDSTHFSARFVSLSKNIELAGDPGHGGEC
jgi:hypothetical protein